MTVVDAAVDEPPLRTPHLFPRRRSLSGYLPCRGVVPVEVSYLSRSGHLFWRGIFSGGASSLSGEVMTMMVKLMFLTGNVYPSPTTDDLPHQPRGLPTLPKQGQDEHCTSCDSPTQNDANFWASPCHHAQLRISIFPRAFILLAASPTPLFLTSVPTYPLALAVDLWEEG